MLSFTSSAHGREAPVRMVRGTFGPALLTGTPFARGTIPGALRNHTATATASHTSPIDSFTRFAHLVIHRQIEVVRESEALP